MKKWVPLLLFAVTSHCSLNAQVKLGILGGLHSSKVLETNHIPGWDTTTKPFLNSRTGFQLGVIVEIPLGHGLFFQPALTYITKGRIFDKNNDSLSTLASDTVYNKQTLKLAYMEIPLNLTYKMPLTANRKNFFFVSAGPYVNFVYSGNVTTESLTSSTHKYSTETDPVVIGKGANSYTTFDYGVNGRAGFEIGDVMLSAYYSRGLGNFYHANYSGTFHHELVGATVGIWLTSSAAAKVLRKKDTDRDGVNDEVDLCPLQPGSAAWHGCPVPDTDHDGIDDDHDSCRNIPGLGRYNGCPVPDTDHDGVDDEHDSCRTVPGLARYNGCPIPDRDHDGLNDEEDKCPDSAGTAENHGCPVVVVPEIKQEETDQINFIAHNVNFASASERLLDSSYVALDQLSGLLLSHPAWHLTIEGYTDNSGAPAKNLMLSRKRADAVRVYLIHKGVPAARLTSTGFGQEHPISDNLTAKGRSINRRVELKLSVDK
ncbi:OmpA family protein [Puia sp.]|uniref:OmpA family protein n=1 Tax=Puia sp. TaxID=2045100 RepID=UPI002F3EAB16